MIFIPESQLLTIYTDLNLLSDMRLMVRNVRNVSSFEEYSVHTECNIVYSYMHSFFKTQIVEKASVSVEEKAFQCL